MSLERTPDLQGPTVLFAFSGWNDAGLAATTAVQYVAERLEAKRFHSIDGEEFYDYTVQRPHVRLDETDVRQITWPTFDFLAADGRGLAFLTAPEPHLHWKSFAKQMGDVCRSIGASRVGLLGSFLAQVVYSDPVPVTGFASDPNLLANLRVGTTSYEGPTGIVGVLLDELRREFPVVSLWAAVPHYIATAANPRAALALILKLREWIELPIDTAPMEAAASNFQAKLLEAVEGDSDLANYVRGLKKDEPSH
ncbi:MAG: PAC2 family protein [Candidatus Binatia bacterium]